MSGYRCPKCDVPLKKGTTVNAIDKPISIIKRDATIERRTLTIWMCDRCWRERGR